jgi:hypothetical protein
VWSKEGFCILFGVPGEAVLTQIIDHEHAFQLTWSALPWCGYTDLASWSVGNE